MKIDPGDTAWLLISTALVMLMTPGLAFFYGGMVGRKNVLGISCSVLFCSALSVFNGFLWIQSFLCTTGKGFWGSLEWIGLKGVGFAPYKDYAATIPHQLFMMFQAMFAIITPALMIGAFAERMKFSAFMVFMVLWTTLCMILLPTGYGGRRLAEGLGALDFAGTVVHINAGIAAFMAAIFIGKRK